jgi:PPK2 family polyphosphate:nucleotide phosphotransferase
MTLNELQVNSSKRFKLSDWNPNNTMGRTRQDCEGELSTLHSLMSDFQYRLYIEGKKSLLIILQGMDTSGKDGTIRHVLGAFNPAGCYVKSFKVPTDEELSHDFLWRIYRAVPQKGYIGVFNRSQYEDVVEVRIRKQVEKSVWEARYDQINQFEKYLHESNVNIIKFFLHISNEEQKKRLAKRLSHPEKRWKVDEDDFERHKKWNRYMKAYEDAIIRCSTQVSPWYIIPADNKWFRNWLVAKIIVRTLKQMKIITPKYTIPQNSKILKKSKL